MSRRRAQQHGGLHNRTPDVVVVGAGSAGCVLANRLSADGADVVVVEAGPDTPPGAVPADIRDTFPRSYYNRAYMWPDLRASLTAIRSEPPGPFPQARIVGGGSSLMGMVALRGLPDDYDAWAAGGASGWAWQDVLPAFRELERDVDYDGPLHGRDGRVPIRRLGPADWPGFTRAIGAAAVRRGYPLLDDLNGQFGDGYGSLPITRDAAERVSAASAFLDADARRRPNLALRSETSVTKLLFDGTRCVGVTVSSNGTTERLHARHVVLCAGALHTPAILLRAGIGPEDTLRRLGIPVKARSPGVGQNLQNHPILYLATHLTPVARQPTAQRTQFTAALRFSSSADPERRADMVMLVMNRSSWHRLGEAVAALGVGLYRPRSRGSVSISSPDPARSPIVRFDMLEARGDVERMRHGLRLALDLMQDEEVRPLRNELFTAAYSETLRRMNQPGVAPRLATRTLAALLDGPAPLRHALIRHGIAGGEVDEHEMRRDAWLGATVARRTFGMYHPAGTCRMGADDDELTVVDGCCAVRGVEGLSVVDASVMPTLVRGTTNLPVMMIAHRVAEMLLEHERVGSSRSVTS